jgi:hypothetical protein
MKNYKEKDMIMKTVFNLAALLVLAGMTVSFTPGVSDDSDTISDKVLVYAEKNLSNTLGQYNQDFNVSAVEVIYDLKRLHPDMSFKKAVIPMMRILRNHEDQNVRVLAAMLLQQIGDGRGTYAVKEAARFDDSKLVRHVCETLSLSKD